jgi:hypothetical protein
VRLPELESRSLVSVWLQILTKGNLMPTDGTTEDSAAEAGKTKAARKVIKGNLPYTPSPGVFKKTLEGIVTAGQPERFTSNFMDTMLGVSGGSSRYVPPLLKKMGFLTSDGSPTDLYTSFRTEGSRSVAAYTGLKNAFAELFQRNEFIHKANEPEVRDNIVAITGLTKSDVYVNYIWSTFKALRDFITGDPATQSKGEVTSNIDETPSPPFSGSGPARMGLVNNINIVLPESTNINVYNLIFQSLRANLMS